MALEKIGYRLQRVFIVPLNLNPKLLSPRDWAEHFDTDGNDVPLLQNVHRYSWMCYSNITY